MYRACAPNVLDRTPAQNPTYANFISDKKNTLTRRRTGACEPHPARAPRSHSDRWRFESLPLAALAATPSSPSAQHTASGSRKETHIISLCGETSRTMCAVAPGSGQPRMASACAMTSATGSSALEKQWQCTRGSGACQVDGRWRGRWRGGREAFKKKRLQNIQDSRCSNTTHHSVRHLKTLGFSP